jgi:general secretion pathway protein G
MRTHEPRVAQRRAARGVTLVEVLVVVAILSLLSSIIAFAVVSHGIEARKRTAKLSASSLRHAASVWRLNHAEECPDFARLRSDRILDKESSPFDPWGSPYSIACAEDDVTVFSAGPDKQLGTADDIVAPPDATVAQTR